MKARLKLARKGLGVLGRPLRLTLFLGSLVAATGVSQAVLVPDAHAESAEKAKVAVGGFEGQKNAEVRSAFIDALKKDGKYEITDAEDVKASAKGSAIVEVAKGLGVNVVITGKVAKGFGLKVKVLSGADGKVIEEVELKGGSLAKLKGNIGESAASSIASAVSQAAPSAPAEEPKEEEKPAEGEQASESVSVDSSQAGGSGLTPLEIMAGLRPLHRTFEFHNTLADVRPNQGFPDLLTYTLPLGPSAFVDLNFFPYSLIGEGPAEWVGLTAGFEKGFGIESVAGEGTPYQKTLKTNTQAFYGGLRGRVPIAGHEIGATGTYGQHTFTLTGDEGAFPLIPDVKYTFIRAGIDATLRFGDVMFGVKAGKRIVMSTGTLETQWFTNGVKTQSLEAGVLVGYRLTTMLDLVAGFDWLRYAFAFSPPNTQPVSYVAGGAVDEYLSGHLAMRFHLPGKGEVAAAPAPSE